MRDDVVEIVRNIKCGSGLPYTILVSNWSLMTEERYLELRDAGMDQFSVSLDFPDERHDDFRVYPGLYRHLSDLIPRLRRAGPRRYRAEHLHHQREPAARSMPSPTRRASGASTSATAPTRRAAPAAAITSSTRPSNWRAATRNWTAWKQRRDAHQLDRQRAQHAGRHAALFRERRHARLQGRPAFPGGHRRWRPAALLDAVRALPAGRPRTHDRANSPRTTPATSATSPSAPTWTRASRNCSGKTSAASSPSKAPMKVRPWVMGHVL